MNSIVPKWLRFAPWKNHYTSQWFLFHFYLFKSIDLAHANSLAEKRAREANLTIIRCLLFNFLINIRRRHFVKESNILLNQWWQIYAYDTPSNEMHTLILLIALARHTSRNVTPSSHQFRIALISLTGCKLFDFYFLYCSWFWFFFFKTEKLQEFQSSLELLDIR